MHCTYCKFFTFTSGSNSADLIVLLFHELYTYSLPQLSHFAYLVTIYSIACWQHSLSCVIDHPNTTGFAWQSSLCLFCFRAVKENHSVCSAVDITFISVCYFLIDCHKNYVSIFVDRPAGSDIPNCRNTCCLSVCLQQFSTASSFNEVSQGTNFRVVCLLRCYATQFSKWVPKFWRIPLFLLSTLKME
jgi:hypothetical protein